MDRKLHGDNYILAYFLKKRNISLRSKITNKQKATAAGSFRPPFSKGGRFLRQRLKSTSAEVETLLVLRTGDAYLTQSVKWVDMFGRSKISPCGRFLLLHTPHSFQSFENDINIKVESPHPDFTGWGDSKNAGGAPSFRSTFRGMFRPLRRAT